MDNMRTSDNSVFAFFMLTLLLSVPLYLLNALAYGNVFGTPETGPVYIMLLTFTPVMAAAILTVRRHGWRGLKALLMRVFDFKRTNRKLWLIPAFLLGALIIVLTVVVLNFLGAPGEPALVPLLALPVAFAFCFLLAAGEEIGWMGYAAEPLQSRFGALRAALGLGVIWAVWHAPFFIFMFQDPVVLAAQLLMLVGTRVLLFWIFNNTGKSVFAVTAYHAAANTALILSPNIHTGISLGSVIQCSLTLVIALAVIVLWDAARLNRFRFGG